MQYSSRRDAIKYGLTLLGGTAFPLGLRPLSAQPATEERVCVSVHGPGGEHLSAPATVTLQPVAGGPPVTLQGGTLPPVIYGGKVSHGEYILAVADIGSLWAPTCRVTIAGKQIGCIGVFMSKRSDGCLFYRVGASSIPFVNNPALLGVLVPGQVAAPEIAEEYVRKFAAHKVKPFLPEPLDPRSWMAARSSIWLLSIELPDGASDADVAKIRQLAANAIRGEFREDRRLAMPSPESIRVGAPTRVDRGHTRILDTRYVVRFKWDPDIINARRWIEEDGSNAKVLRRLSHASGAYLIEFQDHDHPRHLRQTEEWLRTGRFLYIEPDLIVELQQHSCPELPNDGVASCQDGLKRQRVPEAWCLLESELGAAKKFGHPSVCVGLIEDPADPTHPDLAAAPIAYCHAFNWSGLGDCYRNVDGKLQLKSELLVSGKAPSHGTWVFGVGGAVTGNSESVAGIAPGSIKVIAVPPTGVAISKYCEVVLWLAGLGVPGGSSPPPVLGGPGNLPAADIINCSHGVGFMPTPAQVCDTFARVTQEGRNGKGTVLIYSAGNGNSPIENVEAFADDPHVITVGATVVVKDAGKEVEKRWDGGPTLGSNFGESLDLCAIGANVPLLDPHSEKTYQCNENSYSGVFENSGTSFAAPAVAAACALMLTANANLKWCDVRDLLRKSASRPSSAADPNLQEPGKPDGAWSSDRNRYFGSGRLDVYGAVSAALEFTPDPGQGTCAVPCNYAIMCTNTDGCGV